MSPTLIESELFGHRKGAYTGTLDNRAGWLEVCKPLGTIFLDEIGELDAQIQVETPAASCTPARSSASATPRPATSPARSSLPPTATWPTRCRPAASARTSTTASAPT